MRRTGIRPNATPYLSAGWPWWWLLLLLLLLLLLILLCCLLLWCLQRRRRPRYVQEEWREKNGATRPLMTSEVYESSDVRTRDRGGFEDGYNSGYRDASRFRTGADARRYIDERYSRRDDRFHEGYAKGLRDAGGGMTGSLRNLAQRPSNRGYSAGYMQGFRDGNSGIFGERITESLLRRLEEQYPDNDEFRQGYLDGFKEGAAGGRSEQTVQIHKSLTELTERLHTLEKTAGDEVHNTKIYHVYNQGGDTAIAGEQLAQELQDIGSRRSTLRRHYTPGDYLKYGSDAEAYNSLGRTRRTMSASALGREGSHNWADDLINIVHEPMGQTMDRMRRFSTSVSNVDRGAAAAEGGEAETVVEKFDRHYKEEFHTGGEKKESQSASRRHSEAQGRQQ